MEIESNLPNLITIEEDEFCNCIVRFRINDIYFKAKMEDLPDEEDLEDAGFENTHADFWSYFL